MRSVRSGECEEWCVCKEWCVCVDVRSGECVRSVRSVRSGECEEWCV